MSNVSGGSVVWDLDVDNEKLSRGLTDARNEVKNTADQVDRSMDGVKKSTKSAAQSFKELADSAVIGATVITGALGLVATAAINLGADYQSARVSFETFLQSGEKAGKLLSDLGEFAAKTPFDLPQVVDGSKRLLAYGIAANDIIPTFRMLGDLSSGNKVRLDQLTLAYGQVRAATKLTGAELRQFTEAGIPLLDALAAEFNKNGGAMVAVGGAAKKTKVDVGELNDKLGIAKKRLEEASKSGKTKESTLMSLKNTVQNYEQKLSSANATGADTAKMFKKVKVTAGDVKEMISDGGVTFENVNAALQKLTASGGMFFNNMENQSKTFAGVMSNVGDEVKRFALETLGFFISGESAGTVRKGSIFASLQTGAEGLLKALQDIRPIATQFVDSFVKNQTAIITSLGALLGLLTPLAIAFVAMIAPALLFAAAGAAIAFAIQKIITYFGGFETVKNNVIGGFTAFTAAIQPAIDFALLLGQVILTSLTPAWESLKNAFVSAQPMFDMFIQQVGPMLVTGLQLVGLAVTGLIVVFGALVSGIVQAFAFALPFVIGAMASIAQTFRGAFEIILGIFTLNWDMIKKGLGNFVSGFILSIGFLVDTVIALIAGFFKGVIDFFMRLYDELVGHSIIPDMVNAIVQWFAEMPGRVFSIFTSFLTSVKEWGERIARSFVDGFSKLGDWMKEKVKGALDSAKGALEGHSPPREGPFKQIDVWGFNIGKAWVDGLQSAIGGFDMSSVPLSTTMDSPRGGGISGSESGRGGGDQSIVVNIGTVQNKSDIDMITREIGFRAALLPAV